MAESITEQNNDLGYAICFVGREENRSQPKRDPPLREDTIDWIEFSQTDDGRAFASYRYHLTDATVFKTRAEAIEAIRTANRIDGRPFEDQCSYIIPLQPSVPDSEFYGFDAEEP